MSEGTRIQYPPPTPTPSAGAAAEPTMAEVLRRLVKVERELERRAEHEAFINEHENRLDAHDFDLRKLEGVVSDLRDQGERLTQAISASSMCIARIDSALPKLLEFIKSK